MGLFDLFGKKKAAPLTLEQKTNLMWDLWAEGKAEAPYAQLMTYQSEVNNGGHSQYFFNVANTSDLKAEMEALLSILPEPLRSNLQRGYAAFAAQEDIDDDVNDDLFNECDDVYYANEGPINDLLAAYAETMKP